MNFKLIVYKYFNPSFNNIPKEFNQFVPLLGPLYISLNIQETCIIKFYPFLINYTKIFLIKKI